ncbi:hypothetical protein C8J56DRAFT_543922 [Mycena floridula]|nr:hypothetical protein C8J56DRAFT_543922 [Mycena floridula]
MLLRLGVSRTAALFSTSARYRCPMPTAKFTDEIVEDSEPEREQLREQRRQKRRVEKAQKTAKSNVVAVVEKEVIELTDDEPSHNERLAQLQTIEVSDDSYAASPILAAIMNSPSPVSSPHVPPSVSVLEISSDSSVESVVVVNPVQLNPPSPQNLERHILNDFAMDHTPFFGHNQGSPPSSKLDLARFAFKGPHLPSRPKSPKLCPSRSESSIEKMPPPAEPKKKANRKDPSLFLDDISDAQLNLLGKCISCDIKWTTRKGASQKRAHIKSCSKKRAFSNDTLRLLIRREIDAAPVLTLDKGKGKLKAPEEPAIPASVFDTVVNEAAPKKRAKRKEVVETVKEPTTRRESILAKAKGILGHEGQSTEMPATQSFGQSGLGRAKKSIMFGDSEEDSDQEVPPSTRAFIPSKFGRPARESPWDLMGAPPSPVLAESDVTNRVASGSKLAGLKRAISETSFSEEDLYRPAPYAY